MHDADLRKLLLETCPVKPGQESRAWSQLQARWQGGASVSSRWYVLPGWRGLAMAAALLAFLAVVGDSVWSALKPVSLATADSQSPGIYATAFYSDSAQAQVVWLNGMEPASDRPTYLDPTSPTAGETEAPSSKVDPNSL